MWNIETILEYCSVFFPQDYPFNMNSLTTRQHAISPLALSPDHTLLHTETTSKSGANNVLHPKSDNMWRWCLRTWEKNLDIPVKVSFLISESREHWKLSFSRSLCITPILIDSSSVWWDIRLDKGINGKKAESFLISGFWAIFSMNAQIMSSMGQF